MFAVLKREFRSYFQNVIGWLFVAALMALFGLYFYVYNLRQGYPYLYYTLSAITIIFMIAVPILTMRSFAEDRKNKTDQLMLTAPVPVAKVVLGKYLAMLAVFTVDIAVFCVTPLILRAFGTIPMGESYIAILAFWLYGAASIAVGMFISALTESQVIAAVLTFVVLFISYMMQSLTGLISSDGNWLTKILNCLDLYAPFEKFQGGCLDIAAILYYVTVIVLFNFFTVQAIQKRRWSISKKTFSLSVFSSSFIVVVFALAVVANLAVDALPTRITSVDCSYSKLYSITKDTKKTMKKLKSDVTIYVLAAEKSKDAQIDSMLEQGNGYITTRAVTEQGISKPYFAEYVHSRELERVAHGVYQSPDAWPDDMYVLHLRNSNIIFSHQSALALHGMMEREPHHIYVTVKQGYNATHLRKQGVIVHTVSPEIFTLGLTSATTTFGNTVPTYDRERTLCDVIRQRGSMDVQTYQTAIREYMLHGHKNLPHLIRCSRALKVEDDVRRYLEVLLL